MALALGGRPGGWGMYGALLVGIGGLGVAALVASRRGGVPNPAWRGAPSAVATTRTTAEQGSPPAPRHPTAPRQVAAALGRVEARELLSSPWFGVGVGFLALIFLALVVLEPQGNGGSWTETFSLAPFMVHPLVGMVVLASHRAVTRPRHDGVEELFGTCPTSPATRTVGVLRAAWAPVVATLVFVASLLGGLAVRSPDVYGPPGAGAPVAVLSTVVLAVGGVVLGVALGRWVSFGLAPVVAVVAIGLVSLRLGTMGEPGWNPVRLLSTAPPLSKTADLLPDPAPWANLGWLVGLTIVTVLAAVARHRRDRTVAAVAALAGLLVVASGLVATRPIPAERAARVADLIARPAAHQSCAAAGGPVQVCVYSSAEVRVRMAAEVAPVAAALPAGSPPITLRQAYPGSVDDLPAEVARRLPDGIPLLAAGEVRLAFDIAPDQRRVARFHVAFAGLGLPVEPDPGDRPVVVAGQARGVVALWLATRGLDGEVTRELTTGREDADIADTFGRGYVWPGYCSTSPVVWSAQDLAAARALVALPEVKVKSAVDAGWDRWRDPATGTDELLAALGLAPVGPFDAVETRRENPC